MSELQTVAPVITEGAVMSTFDKLIVLIEQAEKNSPTKPALSIYISYHEYEEMIAGMRSSLLSMGWRAGKKFGGYPIHKVDTDTNHLRVVNDAEVYQ